jgi:hypothetical protein
VQQLKTRTTQETRLGSEVDCVLIGYLRLVAVLIRANPAFSAQIGPKSGGGLIHVCVVLVLLLCPFSFAAAVSHAVCVRVCILLHHNRNFSTISCSTFPPPNAGAASLVRPPSSCCWRWSRTAPPTTMSCVRCCCSSSMTTLCIAVPIGNAQHNPALPLFSILYVNCVVCFWLFEGSTLLQSTPSLRPVTSVSPISAPPVTWLLCSNRFSSLLLFGASLCCLQLLKCGVVIYLAVVSHAHIPKGSAGVGMH